MGKSSCSCQAGFAYISAFAGMAVGAWNRLWYYAAAISTLSFSVAATSSAEVFGSTTTPYSRRT